MMVLFVPFSEGSVKSTDEVHVLGKVQSGRITGNGLTSIYGDIGTQGVMEYIKIVSCDVKGERSTPGEC